MTARAIIQELLERHMARFGYASVTRSRLDSLGEDGDKSNIVETICREKGWHAIPAVLSIGVLPRRSFEAPQETKRKRR